MPPGEYTITIKQIDLCLFLPITDIVKYRKSQFYATNHKSHQNAMYLTDQNSNLNGKPKTWMDVNKLAIMDKTGCN